MLLSTESGMSNRQNAPTVKRTFHTCKHQLLLKDKDWAHYKLKKRSVDASAAFPHSGFTVVYYSELVAVNAALQICRNSLVLDKSMSRR